jgi:putative Holliday junction resolvase
MRWLGLDFGTRRLGLAVSEQQGWCARGLATIERRGGRRDLEAVARLAREQDVAAVVIGLPRNMDGSEGRMARLARDFAARLGEHSGLPVHLWDERLSSFTADEAMQRSAVKPARRKGLRDQVAAAVILEDWLRAQTEQTVQAEQTEQTEQTEEEG